MINKEDCIKCGLCCYFPKHIGKIFIDGEVIINEDGYCNHYTKNGGCDIYETKQLCCEWFEKDGEQCLFLRKKYPTLI